MAILIRVILLLLPIIALLLWLRWRSKRDLDEATKEAEFRRFRIGLLILVSLMTVTTVAWRFTDDRTGGIDEVYVPARVDDDGNLIPGHFVPKEEEGEDEDPPSGSLDGR